MKTLTFSVITLLVVTQSYEIDVIKECAIRGNSAVMKCQVPSYVSDFVHVVSWITEDSDYTLGSNYGSRIVLFKVRVVFFLDDSHPNMFLTFYESTVFYTFNIVCWYYIYIYIYIFIIVP